MERISSPCNRVIVLRATFETRATSGSVGSAYAPPRLTKPSRFLRDSAAANGSPNSLAIAAVIELPPIGMLREKTFAGSIKRRFVVRADIHEQGAATQIAIIVAERVIERHGRDIDD